ncbi:MAG TPA: tRNA (adenosine(37)-N6)-threonylcarbamoyltransferase complex dimerization subunit type 1 TsaB [Solirubrobacterales bacterium]|nr:tRNA (adenosine(37)-N6)-threonylcarbamoyltransferase complex dimerization subunit type 1 TsaB [Solirubrobacterales bacterium]
MHRVLGFDTSTAHLTVAVTASSEVVSEQEVKPDETGRPRHARRLLEAVESALEATGGWDGVGLIAVGAGPGTFTGLRIGISTARALAQARGLPVTAVSSLRALAEGARGGTEAPILAMLDAKRQESFAALYGPAGEERWAPCVGGPAELGRRIAALPDPPLAVGDGAVRFRAEFEASGARVPPDADPRHRLYARHVCRLAEDTEAEPLADIKPTYLRRPDAELWRERDRGSTKS